MLETTARDRLIVALDLDAHDAIAMAHALEGTVSWLKVGMSLFYDAGPDVVPRLTDLGFSVFLDLKLHDIPHQVEVAAATIARLGAGMITVHASGGAAMVEAAVRGSQRGAEEAGVHAPAVLGVTVLTSMNDSALSAIGVDRSAVEHVPLLARVARVGGAQGVVCSPHEAAMMRELLGKEGLVVTPGVRPVGSVAGDQSRIATPATALMSGASHLVVGRPITAARDPAESARRIIEEMEGVQLWPNP